METPSPRLRSVARWLLICCFAAALVPSVLCLARKVSAFGRADVLVSPEPEGLRVRRVGDSAAPSGLRAGDLLLLVDGAEARQVRRSFALARRALRRADRPPRRRAPDLPKRSGFLVGLAATSSSSRWASRFWRRASRRCGPRRRRGSRSSSRASRFPSRSSSRSRRCRPSTACSAPPCSSKTPRVPSSRLSCSPSFSRFRGGCEGRRRGSPSFRPPCCWPRRRPCTSAGRAAARPRR